MHVLSLYAQIFLITYISYTRAIFPKEKFNPLRKFVKTEIASQSFAMVKQFFHKSNFESSLQFIIIIIMTKELKKTLFPCYDQIQILSFLMAYDTSD